MWDLWESTGNGPLVSPPVTKCRYAVSHAVRCLGRAPPTPLERPGREGPRADGVFASGASQQTSLSLSFRQVLTSPDKSDELATTNASGILSLA